MRGWVLCMVGCVLVTGCAGRKSSLLLERQARGPLEEEPAVGKAIAWRVDPSTQTETKDGVEVTVNHASPDYLKHFFSNKAVFGDFAGKKANPFYPEHLVFYVKIANHSEGKIRISPAEFVLVDDRGNQYSTVGVDYITAFGEYRRPVSTTTRSMLEEARPGYFGFSFPVGKLLASKPQGQFALLQQSSIQPGYLYPGVAYDGLIAFWNPVPSAQKLRVLITNIKTAFDATDAPRATLEFPFEFNVTHP